MRQIFLLLVVLTIFSCKEKESEVADVAVEDNYTAYHGEFLFVDGRSLMLIDGEGYAVQIDDKMEELDRQAQPFKKTKYDMVIAKVKGETVDNPARIETGEGWEKMLVIKEIIEVKPASQTTVLQASQSKEENK